MFTFDCAMKQVEERHVANQVDIMVWSNKLDLLALSNCKGEVQVYRLSWQKVWSLPAPSEDVTVRALAWRPDGKVLAIGYSTGSVYIVDIEDKEFLHKYDLEKRESDDLDKAKQCGVTCIAWVVKAGSLENATEYNIYDDASIFLQKPATTTYKTQGVDDNAKGFKEIKEQTQLNMLIVAYGAGHIYMSIFGRYPFGTLNLNQLVKDECGEFKIVDVCLSNDFSVMQIFYIEKNTNHLFLAVVNTSVMSAFAEEMFIVANKHGQIVQLLSYLDQTMVSITEAWEQILLEMDNKMAYYADTVPEGGVSADLLELLMLGVPSDELELFLLQDLTTKGLKKFGSSVELSYSTIQKLVLKQLNIVGQSLTYYLAEIRGLTRIPDRFKILGLDEATVTEAIRGCCAFLNKCLELQQVIDVSMRNYKAFFRWLFVVIVRLLDEPTPSEIVKITQQELTHIAEFLYNFDNVQADNGTTSKNSGNPTDKSAKFNLERLGQYLQDQDLKILPDDEDNPWHKFLNENTCLLKDSETIFSMLEFRKFSLVQQQKFLKSAIDKVFDVTAKDIGKYFSIVCNFRCLEDKRNPTANLRVSQMFDVAPQSFLMAFLNPDNRNDSICFMSFSTKEGACSATAIKYSFSSDLVTKNVSNNSMLNILDLQFYSAEYLYVLVQHPHLEESSIFIHVPIKIALSNSSPLNIRTGSCIFTENTSKINLSPLLDEKVCNVLDKMDGAQIAVSGTRKVAVVLSKNCRRVRVYETEVLDEDDKEETLDTSAPEQEMSDNSQEEHHARPSNDVEFENISEN